MQCFIHFNDVSQLLTQVRAQRLLKFISCRKRWVKLEGEISDICQKSYNLFTDKDVVEFLSANTCEDLQWYYHQNCYKRICDKNKLKAAKAKYLSCRSNEEETDSESARILTRSSLAQENKETGLTARTSYILPPRCIICEKGSDLFVMVSLNFIINAMNRSRDSI